MLGDWTTVLELDRAASLELRPGHWQLIFRQSVDGVRVENARLDFHINQGRLVMFGAALWGRPTIRGIPSIDADRAWSRLGDYLEAATAGFERVGDPELAMIPLAADDGASAGKGLDHALIWRLRFQVPARLRCGSERSTPTTDGPRLLRRHPLLLDPRRRLPDLKRRRLRGRRL